jgi:hypothetical protein
MTGGNLIKKSLATVNQRIFGACLPTWSQDRYTNIVLTLYINLSEAMLFGLPR